VTPSAALTSEHRAAPLPGRALTARGPCMAVIVDGARRGRPGKWLVDYKDVRDGRRRWATCGSEPEALRVLAEVKAKGFYDKPAKASAAFDAFARHWLRVTAPRVAKSTLHQYESLTENHLVPAFGSRALATVTRTELKMLLARKSEAGLSGGTVRAILAVLSMIFSEAQEDGYVDASPVTGLSKRLPRQRHDGPIKAFSREQLVKFLGIARESGSPYCTLLTLMARTGLRLGEALALQWSDVDTAGRFLTVTRSKTATARRVDLGADVAAMLDAGRNGHPEVFPGVYQDAVRVAFKRLLKLAGLPLHLSPHGLRHGYASIMLQMGEPVQYVQRQLGHASIRMTVDTYGRWLSTDNRGAADRLAEVIPVATK
jgi:integrase